jgi:serine/threonine-protein kinase RsbW
MTLESNKEKCFCTISSSAELVNIRNFVVKFAKGFGFDDKVSHNIALAVDEACSNLIKYAFNLDSTKDIQVSIDSSDKNQLVVKIEDDALPFNPLDMTSPDMEQYFKSFKKGGLGIHIMKLVMDEIDYIPKSLTNPNNTLLLKKQLKD